VLHYKAETQPDSSSQPVVFCVYDTATVVIYNEFGIPVGKALQVRQWPDSTVTKLHSVNWKLLKVSPVKPFRKALINLPDKTKKTVWQSGVELGDSLLPQMIYSLKGDSLVKR